MCGKLAGHRLTDDLSDIDPCLVQGAVSGVQGVEREPALGFFRSVETQRRRRAETCASEQERPFVTRDRNQNPLELHERFVRQNHKALEDAALPFKSFEKIRGDDFISLRRNDIVEELGRMLVLEQAVYVVAGNPIPQPTILRFQQIDERKQVGDVERIEVGEFGRAARQCFGRPVLNETHALLKSTNPIDEIFESVVHQTGSVFVN